MFSHAKPLYNHFQYTCDEKYVTKFSPHLLSDLYYRSASYIPACAEADFDFPIGHPLTMLSVKSARESTGRGSEVRI